MATLYTINTGFRFPYTSTTDASTHSNLMFLEAQLDEYLHEHSVDASNVLWVTDKGIRLPHDRSIRFLDQNMKTIEAQLEQYLHNHTTSDFMGTMTLVDSYDLDNSPEQEGIYNNNPNGLDYGGGSLWATVTDTFGDEQHVVEFNPADGTIRNDFTIASAVDDTLGGITYKDEVLYVMYNQNNQFGTPIDVEIWTVDASNGTVLSSGTSLGADDFKELTVIGDTFYLIELDNPQFIFLYNNTFTSALDSFEVETNDQGLSTNGEYLFVGSTGAGFETIKMYSPAGVLVARLEHVSNGGDHLAVTNTHVYVNPSAAHIDVYTYELVAPTLFVKNTGFRFPYQDNSKPGAVNANMKFLETQISQYLHKHEEGVGN